MRATTRTVLIAAVTAAALALAGCGGTSSTKAADDSAAAAEQQSSESASPEKEPAPDIGKSLDHPAAADAAVKGDLLGQAFTMTFSDTIWNADDRIAQANRFNDKPDPGMQYLTVTATVKNTSDDSISPGSVALGVGFATGGKAWDQKLAVTDKSFPGELAPGLSADGTLVFQVPEGTETGAYTVDDFFVAAQ